MVIEDFRIRISAFGFSVSVAGFQINDKETPLISYTRDKSAVAKDCNCNTEKDKLSVNPKS
jgi:hypothetical protein